MNNVDGIKLQNMLKWHHDTHDAILWLRRHRHLFKMEVFEPPYMCMTVPAQAFQAGVEALMNSSQLRVGPSSSTSSSIFEPMVDVRCTM